MATKRKIPETCRRGRAMCTDAHMMIGTSIQAGLVLMLLLSGCSGVPPHNDLSSGTYVFVADFTDIPDNETTHDESEFTIARDGTNVTIKGMIDVGRWWVGSVDGNKLFLNLHEENPDPMAKAMELRMILEGEIKSKDYATGIVKGYAGTDNYITGTWTLKKEKLEKIIQQSGPGYPPQSVGSPDP